jgi:hypothetical protein
MLAKVGFFGSRFGLGPEYDYGLGNVPDLLAAKQCKVVKSSWTQTCGFGCLPVSRVKALTDEFSNVHRFVVLEN